MLKKSTLGAGGTPYAKGAVEILIDESITLLAFGIFISALLISCSQMYIWFIDGVWPKFNTLSALEGYGLYTVFLYSYPGLQKTIFRILNLPFATLLFATAGLLPVVVEIIKPEAEKLLRWCISKKRWIRRKWESEKVKRVRTRIKLYFTRFLIFRQTA